MNQSYSLNVQQKSLSVKSARKTFGTVQDANYKYENIYSYDLVKSNGQHISHTSTFTTDHDFPRTRCESHQLLPSNYGLCPSYDNRITSLSFSLSILEAHQVSPQHAHMVILVLESTTQIVDTCDFGSNGYGTIPPCC